MDEMIRRSHDSPREPRNRYPRVRTGSARIRVSVCVKELAGRPPSRRAMAPHAFTQDLSGAVCVTSQPPNIRYASKLPWRRRTAMIAEFAPNMDHGGSTWWVGCDQGA